MEREGHHRISWVARDGQEALVRLAADEPELILLDLALPDLDGAETTRRIRQASGCPILIIINAGEQGSGRLFDALGQGAQDVVTLPTPADASAASTAEAGAELLRKIRSLERLQGRRGVPAAAPGRPARAAASPGGRPPLIAIGSSTGGPGALVAVLSLLPADCGWAVVVAQHIDAQFAPGLVSWLDGRIPMRVRPAEPGLAPQAGSVFVSARNDHLVLQRDGRFAYVAEPLEEPYRPSVTVLFRSLVAHWSRPGVAVLLTGMGRDGAQGLLELRQAGWLTLVQEESSCAVYGMPRAAVELGAAMEVLTPEAIGRRLCQAPR